MRKLVVPFVLLLLAFRAHAEPGRELYVIEQADVAVLREEGTFIVLLDRDAIRRKYAETKDLTDERLEAWVLERTSFMRRSQTTPNAVNDRIRIAADASNLPEAFQPVAYNRAFVLVFKSASDPAKKIVIDLKGTGTADPRAEKSRNGLLSIPVAVKEFYLEKVLAEIMKSSGLQYGTVEHLGALGSDFNLVKDGGGTVAAGKLWREAHRRGPNPGDNYFAEEERAVGLESLFRLHGITTTIPIRLSDGTQSQDINVQITGDGKLFDFGHYRVQSAFDNAKPVTVPMKPARPGRWGLGRVWNPGDAALVNEAVQSIRVELGDAAPAKSEDAIYDIVLALMKKHQTEKGLDHAAFRKELEAWMEKSLTALRAKLAGKSLIERVASGEIHEPAHLAAFERAFKALPITEKATQDLVRLTESKKVPVAIRRRMFGILAAQSLRQGNEAAGTALRHSFRTLAEDVPAAELAKELMRVRLSGEAGYHEWESQSRSGALAGELA